MKMALAGCVGAMLLFVPASIVRGQQSRFELGQRLHAFEVAWERQSDADARARAAPHLNTAVRKFFGFRMGRAARSLDRAKWELRNSITKAMADASQGPKGQCKMALDKLVDQINRIVPQ